MEVRPFRIVRVLHNQMETKMQYKKRWGYMLATTKYPGLYRKKGGSFLVRARVKDPAGRQREIFQSLDYEKDIEALAWLENEKVRIKSGIPLQPETLFSEFAASLLERKILRKEIRSKAGKDKWRHTLTHLIGGTEKGGYRVQGLGDYPVTEIRVVHVEAWKDDMAILIKEGHYAPTTVNGWLAIMRVVSKAIAREFETRDFMLRISPIVIACFTHHDRSAATGWG
jgi:hypothetical protein